MIVVASMKYPPHSTHMRCGLSSVIFILVVRCILSERWGREGEDLHGKKRKKVVKRQKMTALSGDDLCLFGFFEATASFMLTWRQTWQVTGQQRAGAANNHTSITPDLLLQLL